MPSACATDLRLKENFSQDIKSIGAIGGWMKTGVGQRYGTGQPLEVKAKWMRMVDLC